MCQITLEYCTCCRMTMGLADAARMLEDGDGDAFVQCKLYQRCNKKTYIMKPFFYFCDPCVQKECWSNSSGNCMKNMMTPPRRLHVLLTIIEYNVCT